MRRKFERGGGWRLQGSFGVITRCCQNLIRAGKNDDSGRLIVGVLFSDYAAVCYSGYFGGEIDGWRMLSDWTIKFSF